MAICPGFEGTVHVSGNETWLFQDYNSFVGCSALMPSNRMYIAPKIVQGCGSTKQFLIVRPRSGAMLSSTNTLGTASSPHQNMKVEDLVGQRFATIDGTPVIMGAPLTRMEEMRINENTPGVVKNPVFYGVSGTLSGGGMQWRLVGGANTLFGDPVTIAIIIACVIIAVVGAWALVSFGSSMAATAASMAEAERYKMQSHVADDAAKSTQIEKQWTEGDYTYTKYYSGQIVQINNKTGEVKIVTEPGVNWNNTLCQAFCPPGTQCDPKTQQCVAIPTNIPWTTIILGVVVIGGLGVGLYFTSRYFEKKEERKRMSPPGAYR